MIKAMPVQIEPGRSQTHVLAPPGTRRILALGQRVIVVAWLQRFFDEAARIRGWERVVPEGGAVEGVVVGLRTLYSGVYVPGRFYGGWSGVDEAPAHLTNVTPHRAVLVAYDLRRHPRYALTDDVEIVWY